MSAEASENELGSLAAQKEDHVERQIAFPPVAQPALACGTQSPSP